MWIYFDAIMTYTHVINMFILNICQFGYIGNKQFVWKQTVSQADIYRSRV